MSMVNFAACPVAAVIGWIAKLDKWKKTCRTLACIGVFFLVQGDSCYYQSKIAT